MSTKTATGLVAYANAQLGKPYWYATFGNKPTLTLLDQKVRQYPERWKPASRIDRAKAQHIGKFDRVHDCVGLIKGYLWSDTPTSAPKYNAAQDKSADGMLAACAVKGKISTLPETPGALVFLPGHVGVYIGGGQVVEAQGRDLGVRQTALKSRPWTHWGLCPYIQYDNAQKPTEAPQKPPEGTPAGAPGYITHTLKRGETLWLLAVRYLGNGSRWTEIAELNGIEDERKIPVGKKIKIPKREE